MLKRSGLHNPKTEKMFFLAVFSNNFIIHINAKSHISGFDTSGNNRSNAS